MSKTYLLVEGHGEVEAAGNLVVRLTQDLGLALQWGPVLRWKNLHRSDGVKKASEYVRSAGDASGLLMLRDEDDACPREMGPEIASWLREFRLPFPSSLVLLKPEYEVLFLPCLHLMAGRTLNHRAGLLAGTRWDASSWESRRGIKEWLTRHFPPNRSYKPTLDQLPMTRSLDFTVLRAADVPCFGTLERAIQFLAAPQGGVYP